MYFKKIGSSLIPACALVAVHSNAQAQDSSASATASTQTTDANGPARASDAFMGDIIVTATKKTAGESLQKVPISAAVYGEAQLEAMQFKDLQSVAYTAPNVQLDAVGSIKGLANFTIRGIGINSSVPSIEPAVGTFIDGVYLGTNYGVILDTFDVESVEVLRGPQGVLFGRNVTGGAVSVRTRRPDGTFRVKGKLSADSGLRGTGTEVIAAASLEGTLVPDTVFAKVTGYYSHDGGYFYNTTTKRNEAKDNTWFVRPTFVFEPSDTLDITLIGEHGRSSGDGAVSSNPGGVVNSKKFQTASNYAGFNELEHNSVTLEINQDVGLGDGTITNIAGYRDVEQSAGYDVDGSANTIYNIQYFTKQHQFSNELRYAGRFFDRVDFVTGAYYFTQEILGIQRDQLGYIGRSRNYGGVQKQYSIGLFVNTDTAITDQLFLGLGLRYSSDRKRVRVSASPLTPAVQPCDVFAGTCTIYNFRDAKTFKSLTPRVALRYQYSPDAQIYASFSKGYRSGGYNLRNSAAAAPGPFDDETADAYEIGFKGDFFDKQVRVNLAGFRNDIKKVQRQTAFVLPTGNVTLLSNAGNDRVEGFEGDVTVKAAAGLALRAMFGYTHGKYTKVTSDINGDGAVDGRDLALKLPRLSPWTYGFGAYYDASIAAGDISLQAQFNHRDSAFFNDANTPGTKLPKYDDLYLSASFSPSGLPGTRFTIFGKNLLDAYSLGLNTSIATLPSGGQVTVPGKGRIFGVEGSFNF